ncbi:hypothetical protein [Prosthecodimorpha staleyi]|uniref:Uncharacterized protein n=1 Tax=Prosthecodimorpha staleyi TaxID=2840188 RepID=A0A947GBH6_9HYPH|nr:hypothetical protein [Prosthecodimorpha staleyi]MBT9290283.1 hypothetical protein [Prosthecodimorpha staleyi]
MTSASGSSLVPLVLGMVILFPLALVGMFAGISKLLAAIGGWGRVAERYRARAPVSGRRFSMQSGQMGLVNYRNTLTITVTPEGLHIAILPLFRIGHPPLLIPWTAMRNGRRKRLFWWQLVAFDIGEPRLATLAVPAALFEGRELPI